MKGILCACVLASLQSMVAVHAYEADVHYSTTYVLARAVGWSRADALTIASANEAVDENPDTVAALELETTPRLSLTAFGASSFHQAGKNLRFHCFSKTGGPPGAIAADVRQVMAAHFAEVPDGGGDARQNTRRLIALGVALHCQQDAYSHAGFGGSCGSHSGSCLGHSYQTFLDQVVFGLLKTHRFNPDHPAVSGPRLDEALQETARQLAARRPRHSVRPIPVDDLAALSNALRGSGAELPDEVRRDCNRYIAGKWLLAFLRSGVTGPGNTDSLEELGPEVAVTCGNHSLTSATIIRIPEPRFPRLKADASPYLVRADGTYALARRGTGPVVDRVPNYTTRNVTVQLSHWSQLVALPVTYP